MNRRSNYRGPQNRIQQQSGPNSNNQQNQQQPQQQQQQQQHQQQQQQQQQLQQKQVEQMKEEPMGNNDNFIDSGDDAEGGIGAKMRKIFANRKNLSPAERKRLEKERKARQMRRLRKLLTPKNAVVALHELLGPGMGEFSLTTSGNETTAEIVVNNVRYEAVATNKNLAKARASEKALRDLVIAQMTKLKHSGETQHTNGNGQQQQNEDVEMAEVSQVEEVPMLHLASFALYKLFNDWQNEGFEIPAIKPTKALPPGTKPMTPKVVKTKNDLPPNAAERHPAALLALMRPQIPYEDLGSNNSNDPAKREYSVGVTVDGQRFIDVFTDDFNRLDHQIQRALKSMLLPRCAQQLIGEVTGAPMGQIIHDMYGPRHESSGHLFYNNARYFSIAANKKEVKQNIAEQIFRDLVLNKMQIITEQAPFDVEDNFEYLFAHPDFPLQHLVSYALYKLYQRWDEVGALALQQITVKKPQPKPPKRKRTIADLPPNPENMHPKSLLAYMRPQAVYHDTMEQSGSHSCSTWFHCTLTIDGLEYYGEGEAKKIAQKYAAAHACEVLFNVYYDDIE